jgi:MoxR-like ATPase
MRKLQSLGTSLAIALSVTAASAAPTTFTDRSAFQAELGSFTVETFNSFAVETPFHSSPLATPSGLTLSMSAGVSTAPIRNKIDLPPVAFGEFDVNGTALANVFTRAGESLFLSFAAPMFGVGFDLGAFNDDDLRTQVIGQEKLIDDLLVAILAGGHVLLEGLPGLGKTLLVRSLARCLGLEFARIQFTPDLMPSDVTGTQVVDDDGGKRKFRFQSGPVFAGLVLADEINRATPKTQSSLLEAMQEHSVTVAGTTHALPSPFHVVATQNPIELEGTFPLPEAQLDRFLFRLDVKTPSVEAMVQILAATTSRSEEHSAATLTAEELSDLQRIVRDVLCGTHLLRFVAQVVLATHPDLASADERTKRFVRHGASARAGQAIVLGAKARALLSGRPAVVRADLDACLVAALGHRVLLNFEADAERVRVEDLLPAWIAGGERRSG